MGIVRKVQADRRQWESICVTPWTVPRHVRCWCAVNPHAAMGGPVLLVDDTVDSRWTFTVIAALLRGAGSGPVFPFALAFTSSGTDA